jgi:hypothetical protein
MRWPRRRWSPPHEKAPTNDPVSFAEFQREVAEATVPKAWLIEREGIKKIVEDLLSGR